MIMGITKEEALRYSKNDAQLASPDLPVPQLVDLAIPDISQELGRQYRKFGDVVIVPQKIINASIKGVIEELRLRYPGWTINPSAPEGDSLFFS